MMPAGTYRAGSWKPTTGEIVAGGGITILPWPPGPRYRGDRLAFVYNVYTEPAHRRRGLARMVMEAIHAWCRDAGIYVAGPEQQRRRPAALRVDGLPSRRTR